MKTAAFVIASLIALSLAGCENGISLKPRSGGRPYEVIVTGDNATATALTGSIIGAETEENLPQNEPKFDISMTDGDMTQTTRYARNIVVAVTDSGEYTATRVRYERDAFAIPQMTIYVGAPSVARLRADSAKIGRTISRLIERFETSAAISELKKTSNTKAGKEISRMFGKSFLIPGNMKINKRGSDFIWLSDNSATAMGNICIYTYGGTDISPACIIRKRDSIMRRNMPGETDNMYMRTARKRTPQATTTTIGGNKTAVIKGLWEMNGDAMGGPFVAHAAADSAAGRTVVAEAFVYAPGKKKRNLIKRLEATLYTLK